MHSDPFIMVNKPFKTIKPLYRTISDVAKWYDTPVGQSLLAAQEHVLERELSCMFGYHLMQLSVLPYHRLSESSRINHCFSLAPAVVHSDKAAARLCDLQAIAELDALPLPDETIDVTILHHVLEFSSNPQQVLKEAARVTVPRGHIILFAFNPWSLLSLLQFSGKLWGHKPIANRRSLRSGRLRDWLEFLDFSCLSVRYLSHSSPLIPANNSRWRFVDKQFRQSIPFGATYCIVARKDKVGLTPIKPDWETTRILGAAPLPKRSMTARSGQSALILPLRRRNRIK